MINTLVFRPVWYITFNYNAWFGEYKRHNFGTYYKNDETNIVGFIEIIPLSFCLFSNNATDIEDLLVPRTVLTMFRKKLEFFKCVNAYLSIKVVIH